ncbi:MAG: hypothetical protein JXR58_01205 [Bacteroidales bacterium]|nr:hypothetical protein [Bacteroidales bacterium]
MNTKFLIISLIVLSGTFFFTSCEKSGCTDPNACNYDADAKKDDGSCRYNRDVKIFSQTKNLEIFATSTPAATFYFDEYNVESCYANDVHQVRLKVKNILTDTISIDCTVVMQTDAFTQHWSYDYTVSKLAPGATDSVGVITTNPTSIEGKEFDFPGIYTVTIHD